LTHTIVIRGGTLFDPGSGWDGVERDLFIADGLVVDRLENPAQVIDARGLAVTPGAIDMRGAVAGYGQNYLRLWGALPAPRDLAASYACLGYTHIHEPCLTVPTANYVHQELAAIPILDTSASLTLNLRDFDNRLRDPAQFPEVVAAWSYLLEHSRALTFRLVEPFVKYRQDFYVHRTLSSSAIVATLDQLLELSGSRIQIEATPEVLAAPLPAHPGLHLGALGPALVTPELFEKARQHLENGLAADMGLMPAALPPGLPPLPVKIDLDWYQPFDLNKPHQGEVSRKALHLALAATRDNLAFSVANLSHSPVSTYADFFACLEDPEACARDLPPELPPVPYTFGDWLRCTRTLPARCLGLPDKGHLRPGARADIALYDLPGPATWPKCGGRCRMLIKGGEVVVKDFEVVNYQVPKNSYYRGTGTGLNHLVAAVCRYHSFRPENLLVQPRPGVKWQRVT
jgi:formylmethanofuran dehydrogenase subunit A